MTRHRWWSFLQISDILKWAFIFIAACPIAFLFAMMQMSQITVPFWDHWEQAEFITTYYDRGLWRAILNVVITVDQHTRPVTVRLVFLLNGVLTRWNIASEYIYMYAAIGLALFVHYRLVRKFARTPRLTAAEAALFSIVAIIFCSPANHNNHWWSWMLQLNVNNLLSLLALSLIAFNPRKWSTNVIAALVCWLSVYTLTNGLFLILVVAALSQVASPKPLRPSKKTAFWVFNILLVYWSYFPVAEPGLSAHPAPRDVFAFILIYLGQPVASLLHFPFQNMFEPSPGLALSIACGSVIVLGYATLLVSGWEYFRNPPPQYLLLIGCGLFALLSAGATAWVRVTFDQYGLRNGNSSRYVMTASYMVFGILYFLFAERANFSSRASINWKPMLMAASRARVALGVGAYILFVAISAQSYSRSVKIYKEARDWNIRISRGFSIDGSDTDVDQKLYPNEERLRTLRNDLLRLRIGPYRDMNAAGR